MKKSELVRLLYEEVLNKGRLELLDELFSAQFVDHSTPEQPCGPAGVRQYVEELRRGFPDLRVVVEDVITEGEKLVVRTTWQGTHLGLYEGHEPDGRQALRSMIQIFVVRDGRLSEEWNEGEGLLDS
ncbi:SnoaL-like polyketide cyclase [Thermosporothrix hazakensis]|jgi:predicted ester cyclase|uniref:SnoaL-like polyketide cyclase n=1 Tax=Thermosporothrix hazakensis TaxID=644383 RepID=A0A326UA51_THEHA|nr:ester cyclase [Thermosporothrix hazakensis]PZW31243.1 SnoaL-like polyketide cyclase [Thermosporothrix hazakensis]GCE50845.1 hypothetical protein KTH_57140 [Thermosporothrix hazakensis]